MTAAHHLLDSNDPQHELATAIMRRKEDRFRTHTMTALGERLGVTSGGLEVRTVRADSRRQWRRAGNGRHNSTLRSMVQTVSRPQRARRAD